METESYGRLVSATITNLAIGKKIDIKNLRIAFNVTKTAKSSENTAKISIYNLSRDSRDLVQSRTAEGSPLTKVVLRAGFQASGEKILFRGTGNIVSTHKPPEWITEITAEDSVKELKAVTFEKKYPAGTSISDIVKELLKAAGLSVTVDVPLIATLPLARTFTGDPIKNIQDLSSTYSFVFNMQDEGGVIAPKDRKPKREYIVLLSRSTGMVGRPRIRGSLLVVQALIDPDLRPNNYVDLVTLEPGLSGIYLIQTAKYQGDSWSGDFLVTLELTPAPPIDASLTINTGEVLV